MVEADHLRHTCEDIVRKLIVENEWRLLDEQTFVSLVLERAGNLGNVTPSRLNKEAITIYCANLFQACQNSESTTRQARGYLELHRYLYKIGSNRWPELAEDAAQEAIRIIFENIAQCRDPRTFLAFAVFKLRDAIGRVRKAQFDHAEEIAWDELAVETGMSQTDELPEDEVVRRETITKLLEAISALPNERQQKVITLKYFGGYRDEEIATQLKITANNVRVIRNRAMNRLRQILPDDFDGDMRGK